MPSWLSRNILQCLLLAAPTLCPSAAPGTGAPECITSPLCMREPVIVHPQATRACVLPAALRLCADPVATVRAAAAAQCAALACRLAGPAPPCPCQAAAGQLPPPPQPGAPRPDQDDAASAPPSCPVSSQQQVGEGGGGSAGARGGAGSEKEALAWFLAQLRGALARSDRHHSRAAFVAVCACILGGWSGHCPLHPQSPTPPASDSALEWGPRTFLLVSRILSAHSGGLRAGEGSCALFRERLLPTALSLAADPVPNVRLAVCRLLSQAARCDAGARPGSSATNVQAATGCAAAAAAHFSSMTVADQDSRSGGCEAAQQPHSVSAPPPERPSAPAYDAAFRRLTQDTDGDVRALAAACSSQCLISC